MIRTAVATCLVALCGATSLGCGSTRYEVLEPPTTALGPRRFEVGRVELDAGLAAWAAEEAEASSEVLAEIAEELHDELGGADRAGPPLRLRVRLVTYDEEYAPVKLMGGGSRQHATAVLDVRVLDGDQAAGRVLATGISRKGGWYIPSLGAALDRALDAVVDFVQDH